MEAALELAESAVRYHHDREGCPVTLQAVRSALRKTRHLNPPPALR
jgi:protein subunit release factor B